MRIRRPDRVLAASLLTALGACLALLAQPSSASTLDDSYDIRATVRYGCAQHGQDSFVEVALDAIDRDPSDDRELVLQVGLSGPDSTDPTGVFPEGGPSLVTLGENRIKVRLAGPVHDGDHVFLRQADRPDVITLPLQENCHRIKPTNFGLAEPAVQVAAKSCTAGSKANLEVRLDNPNEVDRQLQKIGIEQIDYTVLLVRQDGVLSGPDPVGTLMSFDEPSASVVTLSEVVAKPARYQVRVIALDGSVVTSESIRLSCAGTGNPGPSSTSRPTPSVPVTPSPSATRPSSTPTHSPSVPVTRTPAPSSSAPATSSTVPISSAPTSSAPTSSAPTSSAAPSSSAPSSSAPGRPATSQPPPPVNSSPAVGVPGRPTAGSSPSRPSVPPARPSSSAGQPNVPPASSTSAPTGEGSASATPSPEPSVIRLVEPRANYSGLPVFEKDVALVVLVFSAALAAMVGMSVINARRR